MNARRTLLIAAAGIGLVLAALLVAGMLEAAAVYARVD